MAALEQRVTDLEAKVNAIPTKDDIRSIIQGEVTGLGEKVDEQYDSLNSRMIGMENSIQEVLRRLENPR